MSQLPPSLIELAELYGVLTEYEDVQHRRQQASADALLTVLRQLGAPVDSLDEVPAAIEVRRENLVRRGVEPVLVAWDHRAVDFTLTLPRDATVSTVRAALESPGGRHHVEWNWAELPETPHRWADPARYATRRLRFPLTSDHDFGYWPLTIDCGAQQFQSLLIHAPAKSFGSTSTERAWGGFLPLYSIRSERNWGAGDFTDLRELAEWVGQKGGGVFGTLPLLAGYLDEPFDPSPYAPATRLFWNEFYIDVEQVAELVSCPEAERLMGSSEFHHELDACRNGDYIDYQRVMRAKRQVLELLAQSLVAQPSPRVDSFRAFAEQTSHLDDYASFRATYEKRREPWWMWPERLRDGLLQPDDYDSDAKHYHLYVQWIAAQQLETLLREAPDADPLPESLAEPALGIESAARAAQLYLDLPLGVRRDGYDVWRNRDVYITGSSVGAPPDAIFTGGQNWGFCPLHPDAIRERGYAHVRHYLNRNLHAARMLRVDHVMGLHRLYWVPDGFSAREGIYVRYCAEELYAILSLESNRHRTRILGENLGTVPPAVNEAMDHHAVRRMFVVQYELQDVSGSADSAEPIRPPFAEPPGNSVASINTHDMPMFSAWWRGEDIDDRRQMDLLDDAGYQQEQQERERLRQALTRWTCTRLKTDQASEVDVLAELLAYLAASPAEFVLVNLEDLWHETRPQNIPGTSHERPNWRRRTEHRLDQIERLTSVTKILSRIDAMRKQP